MENLVWSSLNTAVMRFPASLPVPLARIDVTMSLTASRLSASFCLPSAESISSRPLRKSDGSLPAAPAMMRITFFCSAFVSVVVLPKSIIVTPFGTLFLTSSAVGTMMLPACRSPW